MSAPDEATLSLRRRAELRGLEALAQSRIIIGVWTARLLGSLGILNAVIGLGFGVGLATALGWFVWGAGLHLMPYSEIVGYTDGAREALVLHWRLIPESGGGFRADSVRALVTPLR